MPNAGGASLARPTKSGFVGRVRRSRHPAMQYGRLPLPQGKGANIKNGNVVAVLHLPPSHRGTAAEQHS